MTRLVVLAVCVAAVLSFLALGGFDRERRGKTLHAWVAIIAFWIAFAIVAEYVTPDSMERGVTEEADLR